MYYTREYLNRAHREIDTIFRVLFPEHGMAVREEQIMLCHKMLDNLLGRNIALCDAGVGIGKTYAYLVACVLMRKYSLLAEGCQTDLDRIKSHWLISLFLIIFWHTLDPFLFIVR